jgi:hypothetical protein
MRHLTESQESSSPIVTRAVAAAHGGHFADSYQLQGWEKMGIRLLGRLPPRTVQAITSRIRLVGAQDTALLADFSIETLINQRLRDYAQLKGRFPAITIGVAQGGPSSSLTLALGGLFLPQAFVVSLKGGSYHGDVDEYLGRSLNAALRVAAANPSLLTIQHYDPVHDGWLTRFLNHLRFKLLDLPPAYREFIRHRLKPGGALVYLEGGATWLRYRLGERSVFQIGGWGGLSAEEYLQGSSRIDQYAHHIGLTHTDWRLSAYPLEIGPESEWGSEPGLAAALEQFAEAEGFRFIRLHMDQPHDFSRLAFASMKYLLRKEGRDPAGTLVEMFSQFDTTASFQAGLLPLWLVFNTTDSLEFLRQMRPLLPMEKPVFFSPLSTFSVTPDLVRYDEWELALPGFVNVGAQKERYPTDLRALADWSTPLRDWVLANERPVRARLSAEELLEIAHGLKQPPVREPGES